MQDYYGEEHNCGMYMFALVENLEKLLENLQEDLKSREIDEILPMGIEPHEFRIKNFHSLDVKKAKKHYSEIVNLLVNALQKKENIDDIRSKIITHSVNFNNIVTQAYEKAEYLDTCEDCVFRSHQ